ncbi:MAG: PP2C family protein-serine/threonine phosphatase [bacterium]
MLEDKQDVTLAARDPLNDPQDELAYLRSKVADLSSLIEVSIIINTTLELERLMALVMEKAQSVMKAEASSVMLINEQSHVLECEVALGKVGDKVKKIQLQMGEGIAGWVAQHGEALIIPDVSVDSRFSAKADDSTGFHTKSILAAPLVVKDKIIGVAEVVNRIDGLAFNQEDLELFSTFCRQVAMAIENARMHKLELEKQKLEQELESARIIQQSFMPQAFPSPEREFSISAKSLPAASVGGDFFDFYEFDNGSIGIAVGDVTGKGIPAALYMARLVSDLRLFTQKYRNPARVVHELNELLADRSRRGMFVTFQYGIFDPEQRRFTFANAGHLPFVRIHSSQDRVEVLTGGKGIPLGIMSDMNIEEASVVLEKGDCIVSITDGIIEAKNSSGEAYSLRRTLEVLAKPQTRAAAVVDCLLQDVQAFTADTAQHDDLTILALKWN